MTSIEEGFELFATTLDGSGWMLNTVDGWRGELEAGIPLETKLIRPQGELFATHATAEKHVSIAVVNDQAGEYVEFGFDYETAAELNAVLQHLLSLQDEMTPRTVEGMLRLLLEKELYVCWEHQEEELEPVTPENLSSDRYLFPLLG